MRALLVPVKDFREAKVRLAPIFSAAERQTLARALAEVVLRGAGEMATYVACDDDAVANWATDQGAQVLWTPGLGLSGAVNASVEHLGTLGVDQMVVAHGDLPYASHIATLEGEGEITLVPDRRLDGTNVAIVPAGSPFRFAYGSGSFLRHIAEADRIGSPYRVIYDAQLGLDIDVPADLEHAMATVTGFGDHLSKLLAQRQAVTSAH